MNNNDFYNSIKIIFKHQGTIALIDIEEFKKLTRKNGKYNWVPFEIGSLPAIPVVTNNFKESFRSTADRIRLTLTPNWSFLTNKKKIITPYIESLELTENSSSPKRYKIVKRIGHNMHYFSENDYYTSDSYIQKENAIQWEKQNHNILLTPSNPEFLKSFLKQYQEELKEFNNIYNESSKKVLELKYYQRRK